MLHAGNNIAPPPMPLSRPVSAIRPFFAASAALLLAAGCASGPSGGNSEPLQKAGDPVVARLAEGGFVVYFRHGKTDSTYQDRQDKPEWWKSCDTRRHRPLSDEGRAQMAGIGSNVRALRIPVAAVVSSEYCRAVDSALLLQLRPVAQDSRLNHPDAQRYLKRTDSQISSGMRALLTEKPPAGQNTFLVGHVHGIAPPLDPVFSAIQEAEAVVVRPLEQGKFEIVGRVTADKWGLREGK
jgi:phosphohistidine phosphatase SixA